MRARKIRIRHFRSIIDLEFDLDDLSVVCGPNSCGKSNILKAITFAFTSAAPTLEDIRANMNWEKAASQGAPQLSIWIDVEFEGVDGDLAAALSLGGERAFSYQMRAYRSGAVTRSVNGQKIDEVAYQKILNKFKPIYVPTIRDLNVGGLEPFKVIFNDVLQKARGESSIKSIEESAQRSLANRADNLLRYQNSLAKSSLGATRFVVDASNIHLGEIGELMDICIEFEDGRTVPLTEVGTGHQSLFVLHLYKQLGEADDSTSLFLFEEPDTHLHPATIRAVGRDLIDISVASQVIVTTHSPILANFLGLSRIRAISSNEKKHTIQKELDQSRLSEKPFRALLQRHGLRATEPLFAKRVILVEGPFDFYMIRKLVEVQLGETCDQKEIIVIDCGGKGPLVELAGYMQALGADWRVVVDEDALYLSADALVDNAASSSTENHDALDKVESMLCSSRRAKGASKLIRHIREELQGGAKASVAYAGAPIERIANIVGSLTNREKINLAQVIGNGQVTVRRELLKKINCWSWSGSIENAILAGPERKQAVEDFLIENNVLTQRPQPNSRDVTLKNALHNSAHEISLIDGLVEEFASRNLFSRSELRMAVQFLVEGT